MRQIVFLAILITVFAFISCGNKKNETASKPSENELTDFVPANGLGTEEDDSLSNQPPIGKVYVAPFDGLNLRSTHGITGEKIRLLPQYTVLTILNRDGEEETIDGIHDYWYEVDTGEERGWVFGGYLSYIPNNENSIMEMPKYITERENQDGSTSEVSYSNQRKVLFPNVFENVEIDPYEPIDNFELLKIYEGKWFILRGKENIIDQKNYFEIFFDGESHKWRNGFGESGQVVVSEEGVVSLLIDNVKLGRPYYWIMDRPFKNNDKKIILIDYEGPLGYYQLE